MKDSQTAIFSFKSILDSIVSFIFLSDPGDHRWVGMWWGGFLLCGFLLILVAIPFFSFPKVLVREKEKIRLVEKAAAASGASTSKTPAKPQSDIKDTGYGKDIKGRYQPHQYNILSITFLFNFHKFG